MLIVMSDQHSLRFMGSQGDELVQTPAMDRLAGEGVSFTNCYCPSPLCVPSRMSFMTGRLPSDIRVLTNHDSLSSNIPTFAHALGAAGYDCRLVGRMHFVGPDQLHGFARRDFGDIGSIWPGGSPPDMAAMSNARGNRASELPRSGAGRSSYSRYDQLVLEKSLDVFDELSSTYKKTGRPFCLVVGLFLPHPPFIAPRDLFEKYRGRTPPPSIPKQLPADPLSFDAAWYKACDFEGISAATQELCAAAYYANVEQIDMKVGQLLSRLDESAISEDTAFIYTSDHGEQLGERGMWWKSTFYDQSSKVPLIMRLPGTIPAGRKSDSVASLVDLTATLVDLGSTSLPGISGESLMNIICKSDSGWKDVAYSEFFGGLMNVQTPPFRNRMVRAGRWKFNLFDGFTSQCFDLENDPDELNNLAADPEAGEQLISELTALAGKEWNLPELRLWQDRRKIEVAAQMAWARATQPEEYFRWYGQGDEDNQYE
jgi:choline-sulfatase